MSETARGSTDGPVEGTQRKNAMAELSETAPRSLWSRFLGALTSSSLVRNTYAGCLRIPVLGSLARGVAGTLVARDRRVWIRVSHGWSKGLWWNIDPRFETSLLEGGYESKVQELLATHLRPGDCLFDVGAHIGFFSLLSSRLVGAAGSVVAFEPEPQNLAVLRANAARNNLPQLQIVEAAVWSSSGVLEFGRANQASSMMEGRVTAVSSRNDERIQVTGIAIDDFVKRNGGPLPNIIKIDVEGAELEVLKGAAEVIRSARPTVICEVHYPADKPRIDAWLTERGYQLYSMDDRTSFPAWLLASPRELHAPDWLEHKNLSFDLKGEVAR
jgi:FkbM family methyltransferase